MKKLFPLLLLSALLLAGCAGFLQPVRIGSRPLPVPPAEEVAVEPERSAPAVYEPAPVVHEPAPAVCEPAPAVFAPTPDPADTAVYLDGSVLPAFWQGQAIYVRLHDYVALTGGSCTLTLPVQAGQAAVCTVQLANGAHRTVSTDGSLLCDGESAYLPLDTVLSWTDGWCLADPEQDALYCSTAPRGVLSPGYAVPVLMYHAVSDDCWGERSLFVSPAVLEEQLIFLLENGYTPIWITELPMLAQYEKPVILTFDDGYADNYTELLPLLERYGVKATIFIITDKIGAPRYLTAEQVRELADSGLVSIQSHTVTHPLLDTLSEEALRRELSESQLAIARLTGRVPTALSYPVGHESPLVRQIAAEYYDFGILMDGWCFYTDRDPMGITRYFVGRDTDIWTFRDMARGS